MEVDDREKYGGESSEFPPSTAQPPLPLPPLLPPPPRITFRPLDARSLPDLRALNSALFPINYGPRVYEQALAAGGISHGAYFDDEELVGAITVRLEAGTASGSATAAPAASLFVAEGEEEEKSGSGESSLDGGLARMYVMTVGVLSPWRGKGIGTTLLTNALSMAAEEGGIGVAYLHTHVGNSEALTFYEKKLGFRRGATARGYYRRLSPPDSVVLWRRLRSRE